eukprot:1430187-Rhodomonas_salina.1
MKNVPGAVLLSCTPLISHRCRAEGGPLRLDLWLRVARDLRARVHSQGVFRVLSARGWKGMDWEGEESVFRPGQMQRRDR